MLKSKIIGLGISSAIIFAIAPNNDAQAQRLSYNEYMKRKRAGSLYQPQSSYSQPEYYNYQNTYSAPAPQVQAAPMQQAPVFTPPAYIPPAPPTEQYAMRPPAPYFDTGVPQSQQQELRPTQMYNPPIAAEEPEPEKILGGTISGSVGVTSDYVFRGITQSKEGPAIQAGLEYEHAIGLYAGVWGSNVDFADADEAQVEVDIYGGYRTSLTDQISVDVGALYYAYPGANKNLNYDYTEFFVSGEYALPLAIGAGSMFETESLNLGAAFYYAPEYFGDVDTAYYAKGSASLPFKSGITLDGHVGKQWFKDNVLAGYPDYVDWSVGVAYALPQDFEVKAQYIDTNLEEADCADGCDGKAVVTLTKSF